MRTVLGSSIATAGILIVAVSAVYDLLEGWPALPLFFGGLVVTAAGLTIRHGPGWPES